MKEKAQAKMEEFSVKQPIHVEKTKVEDVPVNTKRKTFHAEGEEEPEWKSTLRSRFRRDKAANASEDLAAKFEALSKASHVPRKPTSSSPQKAEFKRPEWRANLKSNTHPENSRSKAEEERRSKPGERDWRSNLRSRSSTEREKKGEILTTTGGEQASRAGLDIRTRVRARNAEQISKQEFPPEDEVVRPQEKTRITLKSEQRSRAKVNQVEFVKQELAPKEEVMHKQAVDKIVLKNPQAPQNIEVSSVTLKSGTGSEMTPVPISQTHTTFASFEVKPESEVKTQKTFAMVNLTLNCNTGVLDTAVPVDKDATTSLQNNTQAAERTTATFNPNTQESFGNDLFDGVQTSSPVLPRGRKMNTHSATREAEQATSESQAPVFTRKLQDSEVFEGDNARFECHVTGSPKPEVTWYKNDELLTAVPDKHVTYVTEDGRCVLLIKNCTEDDDALYECRTNNAAGKAECNAELYVETGESAEDYYQEE